MVLLAVRAELGWTPGQLKPREEMNSWEALTEGCQGKARVS